MNTSEQLTRGLQEQADRIGGHPIDLESVRGRARGIQRRRRIAAGAVAAAVLAVAVPVGVTVAGNLGQGQGPQPMPSPEPTIEPAPLNKDGSYLLSPKDAPDGEAAQVPYYVLDDRRLVAPAGTFELPGDFSQIAAYGDDGWIGLEGGAFPPFGYRLVTMDVKFDVRSTVPAGMGLAVSDQGTRIAWAEIEDGRVTLVNAPSDAGEPTRVPVSAEEPTAVGFLEDGRAVFASFDPNTGATEWFVVGVDGSVARFGGFQRITGTSEVDGLVAGQTQFLGDRTCSQATDPGGGKPVWETCDHSVGDFSPDGRHLIGFASYSDGLGSPSLAILDAATGQPVVDYRGARDEHIAVTQAIWEDADTILAAVIQGTDHSIVRIELDGRVSRVARALPALDMSIEYRFPQAPIG